MTEHAGYIVTLKKDIQSDDAEAILDAIRMVKGVATVEPVVADINLHMAVQRARQHLADRIWAVLYPREKP